MRTILLSLTILSCWAAELPQDVQTVIDKAESAKVKIDQALIKDLTKLQETYTKKGNLDAANGIKAKVDKLQEEVASKMLEEHVDVLKQIQTLTGEAWKSIKGREVCVSMTGPVESGITIKAGETWIMIPNPDDRWGRGAMFDYKGNPAQPNWAGFPANGYALVWSTDEGKGSSYTITGKGVIRFQVNLGSFGGTGNIRVKLIRQ